MPPSKLWTLLSTNEKAQILAVARLSDHLATGPYRRSG
jgi:hypothetical protein